MGNIKLSNFAMSSSWSCIVPSYGLVLLSILMATSIIFFIYKIYKHHLQAGQEQNKPLYYLGLSFYGAVEVFFFSYNTWYAGRCFDDSLNSFGVIGRVFLILQYMLLFVILFSRLKLIFNGT